MSSSLPARTKALRERLATLDQLGSNLKETGLLDDLKSELAPRVAELSRAHDQSQVLVNSGIEWITPASLDTVRKNAAVLHQKFAAENKAATLKKGVRWTNFIKDIRVASTEINASVVNRWKVYLQSSFTGESPRVINRRIALTPKNKAALKDYERHYQEFRTALDRLPSNEVDIQGVRALATRLTETAKAFDFNVPDEVKHFLEAIQSGGATLYLLTDTVKAWLEENDVFDSYIIRSADGSR